MTTSQGEGGTEAGSEHKTTESKPDQQQQQQQPSTSTTTETSSSPKTTPSTEQTFTQTDVDRIVADRLGRERQKYSDYGELKEQASRAKSVEDQLADMRKSMSERDTRDVQRSAAHALDKVAGRLAEAGIKRDDVSGLLDLVDTRSLLADGAPDDAAIDRLAQSLTRVAGRTTPDPDQGRGGGGGPTDMTSLIRRAAGRGS